jgi:histidinol-phosphate/aromatic aminotransferase/cobyric acid decarboxylase-like protein
LIKKKLNLAVKEAAGDYAKIATNFDIDEDMVIVSNGVDNVLVLIDMAFLYEGDEVLTGEPTFAQYEISTPVIRHNEKGIGREPSLFHREYLHTSVYPCKKYI